MINNEDNNSILGARLSKYLEPRFIIPHDINEYPDEFEVDFISGGINMIRRDVYEKIGFQDEMLFMYGDEVDFDIRVKKARYKILALKNAICWHMHIFLDKSGMRSRLAYFLFSRNMFILYRKHLFGMQRFLGYLAFLYMAKSEIRKLLKNRKFDILKAYLHGAFLGSIGYYIIPLQYQRTQNK
jgi:GT2 family glycosyltransferase